MDYRLGVADGTAFQCRPLAFQHPQLVGVTGDERRLACKLLFRNGPEISVKEGEGDKEAEGGICLDAYFFVVLFL